MSMSIYLVVLSYFLAHVIRLVAPSISLPLDELFVGLLVQCRFIGGRYLLTTVTSLLLLATVTSLLGELNLTTRPGSLEKTPFNPSTETL